LPFQNSPLYQYLQDLGHTDFEVCSSVSQKAEQCAAAQSQREQTVRAAQKQGILSKLVEFFRSWFPFPQYKKNDDILHRLVSDHFFYFSISFPNPQVFLSSVSHPLKNVFSLCCLFWL
uniref:Uncharacterized protein n=1 Tax=Ficedula albicollis TaxID=59894 RepID=A0A803WGJ3_FICAL